MAVENPADFNRLPTQAQVDFPSKVRTVFDRSRKAAPSAPTQEVRAAAAPERDALFYVVVGLIAAAFGVAAIAQRWEPNKWMHGDGAFYMNMTRGFADQFTIEQSKLHPRSWYDRPMGWNTNLDAAWSNIALGRNGEWWPKHPYVMPALAAPFYLALGPAGTLVFNFLTYLLIPLLALRIALRLAPRPAALAVATLVAATPFFNEQAWTFSNDNFYTALLLYAFDAVFDGRPRSGGLAWGIAVMAKATNVFYGPALVLVLLLRLDWRGAFKFCAFAAGPGLVYLGINAYMFGSPFKMGYDRVLVVVGGQKQVHSHANDFNWPNLWPATKSLVFGRGVNHQGGLGERFPHIFVAIPGLIVLALRKPREALAIAIGLVVPTVFHSTFAWYRMQFNLPQVALAVAPAAAMLLPFSPPAARPPGSGRVRWGRLAPMALAGVLVACGIARAALPSEGQLFYRRVPEAQVFLGDLPCDYYNNQMERWECSHLDNDWFMTGRILGPPLEFGGKKRKLVLFHPHPNGQPRIIEYPNVHLTAKLRLEYGLSDNSRAGCAVQFQVLADGEPVHRDKATERGLKEIVVDTGALAGKASTLRFISRAEGDANNCIFVFDGEPK